MMLFREYRAKNKGLIGEHQLRMELEQLPKTEYSTLYNRIFEDNGNLIQIDAIVFSRYGVFVIEMKNFEGKITGTETSKYWTQDIYGYKKLFYNPVKQNYAHRKIVKKLLGLREDQIFSVICFSDSAYIRTNTLTKVIKINYINTFIKNHRRIRINEKKEQMVQILLKEDVLKEKIIEHQNQVKYKKAINEQKPINIYYEEMCPICHNFLLIKNGKYGSFVGCSNYPICKYTKEQKRSK